MLFVFLSLIRADPFGIDPKLSKDYRLAVNQANNSFTCLDQSLTIPLSALNDGKCDCPDNSDEPGTSACLNGHFFCHNEGGKAKSIPSHKVGDGICDCCDGSDEFDNPQAQCPNVCSAMVKKAGESRESIYTKIRAGLRRKKESLKETEITYPQAQRELLELRDEMKKFQHELDVLDRKRREKKQIWKWEKRAAQGITPEMYAEKERRKHDYIYKPSKKVEVEEEVPDPDGLRNPFNEAMDNIDWEVDEGIEELIFHATPRPKPIKRNDVNRDTGHHGFDREDHRIRHRTEKWKKMRKAEKERLQKTTKEQISFLDKAKERVKEIGSKVFGGDQPKSYQEYMAVEHEIEALRNHESDTRIQIMHLEDKFKHSMGKDNVWWPLSQATFELSKDGNDYKIQMFGAMMHRNTGAAWYGTAIGEFKRFNATERTMLYEGGNMCWEGNPRRAEVYLYCGPTNKFLDMEEIDRCVYRGHFETPLCCTEDYIDYIKNMSDLDLADFVSQWGNAD